MLQVLPSGMPSSKCSINVGTFQIVMVINITAICFVVAIMEECLLKSGAIDGSTLLSKHQLMCDALYLNYKGSHSVVLLAVYDAHHRHSDIV